jgi:hypothetical protein
MNGSYKKLLFFLLSFSSGLIIFDLLFKRNFNKTPRLKLENVEHLVINPETNNKDDNNLQMGDHNILENQLDNQNYIKSPY